jgi:hypothetical protein
MSESPKGDQEFEHICQRILDYLNRNPNAEDTLEGITEWWLLEQQIRFESARVAEALNRLVQQSVVTVTTRIDGRVYYRLKDGSHSKNDEDAT